MTHPKPMLAFEVARRRHLVEATIETLSEVGFKSASLSEIARRANVSTGLFAHYFGDKDGLLEATLRFMAARLAGATATRLAAARTGRERLYAVCDAALADEEFDRRTSAVWLAFWGQMAHSKRYQRVQSIYQRRMVSNLRHALRGSVAEDCVSLHATMIAAMIDGLWLRSHVSNATPGDAGANGAAVRAVVHALIDGLLAGAAETGGSARPESRPIAVAPLGTAHPPIRHLSPATGEEVARFLPARTTEIQCAVQDARRGFAAWRQVCGPDRARVLRTCADLLRTEGADLARLESRETGRPLLHTAGVDLPEAVRALEHAARLAEGTATIRTEMGNGRFGCRRQEPLGIVAAQGHWSAAILGLCEQAAALAYGNAVVFVADAGATDTSRRLVDLFVRAGLPQTALVKLRGDAGSARLLRAHPDLVQGPSAACETDDADLGAGVGRDKGVTIVLPGSEPARVAAAILQGGRGWLRSTFAGQSRVYVHADAREGLAEALRAAAAGLRVGDPLDPATQVGPLHSAGHAAGLDAALRADLAAGASLVFGPSPDARPRSRADGPVPLVIDRCTEAMRLVQGHSFAPVVTLLPFDDDLALSRHLAQRGTGVGLFAGDLERAWRMAGGIAAPFCAVNDYGTMADARIYPVTSADGAAWPFSDHPDRPLSRTTQVVGEGGRPA